MLATFPQDASGAAAPAVWYDLESPTDQEIAQVEAVIGVTLPRRGALSEIESSSRLQRRHGVLTMSTPTATHRGPERAVVAPLGFVLAPGWLVTIRFTALSAFDAVHQQLASDPAALPASGPAMFASLCEEIVDQVADGLEHLAEELGQLSTATFHADDGQAGHAIAANRQLRAQMRHVGRLGDRLSEVRDGLLGLSRVLAFTEQFGCPADPPPDSAEEVRQRVTSMRHDLSSLGDYTEHLTNKVQFVLDALVGLIGIAQNDIFKILTIVSIVGIPPTLMAGIWGMNFKNMPELSWTHGYALGWGVIVLSALLPLAWFKWRKWF